MAKVKPMIRLFLTIAFLTLSQGAFAQTDRVQQCEKALEMTLKTCSKSKTQSAAKMTRCVVEAMTRQQFEKDTDYNLVEKKKFECTSPQG